MASGDAWSLVELPGATQQLTEEVPRTRMPTDPKHSTSIAAWRASTPVVEGSAFRIRVGAKCSLGCHLTGHRVIIRDNTDTQVGHGTLRETPPDNTIALHEIDVTLTGPSKPGVYSWSATFISTESESPHETASAVFSFRVVNPPEHRVTVNAREKETQAPLKQAEIQLGTYRASTDDRGQAHFDVPKGTFELHLWKLGYEADATDVTIENDTTLHVEARNLPNPDPDEEQLWM